MKKLCRHWAHKVDVQLSENSAVVQLPFGPCRIDVDANTMKFDARVKFPWSANRAEKFLSSHLIRMANRDEPEVIWQRERSPA